jgi:dipeptidase
MNDRIQDLRVACDSLVALGAATADGTVLFAKNSDRPADECQPLVQLARQHHAAGARVRCQYIEIAEVAETAAVIGSQPFWLWGFEHGLNEHGVAIGNHTVFTKDALSVPGLIGMDLVRLGLERARSAAQAVEIITMLVAVHGQGGSGYIDKDWPYHNSFLIADRREAFLVETSDRCWAVRRIRDIGSASNHLSIGTDWDTLSDGVVAHAVANDWWPAGSAARFDFAGALRDTSVAPPVVSSGRLRRTCEMLEHGRGRLTPGSLRAALRDHYGSAIHRPQFSIEDERFFSVCMHADPVGTTTASMVAQLPGEANGLLRCWTSLASPCIGTFVPCYPIGRVPAVLSRGGATPDDSPWWRFKRLLTLVERDFDRYGPRVRAYWDDFEQRLLAGAEEVEGAAAIRLRHDDQNGAAEMLTGLMERNVTAMLERLDRLIADLEGETS